MKTFYTLAMLLLATLCLPSCSEDVEENWFPGDDTPWMGYGRISYFYILDENGNNLIDENYEGNIRNELTVIFNDTLKLTLENYHYDGKWEDFGLKCGIDELKWYSIEGTAGYPLMAWFPDIPWWYKDSTVWNRKIILDYAGKYPNDSLVMKPGGDVYLNNTYLGKKRGDQLAEHGSSPLNTYDIIKKNKSIKNK